MKGQSGPAGKRVGRRQRQGRYGRWLEGGEEMVPGPQACTNGRKEPCWGAGLSSYLGKSDLIRLH